MPLDPKKREGLEKIDEDFLRIIDEYGWHVMSVAPLAGKEGNLWSYSTGLYYHFQHPEVIVLNQRTELRVSMINGIGNRIKAGEKFVPGKGYAEIIGDYDCQFRPVDITHYKDYVGFSVWFYDHDPASFPMLQCFWPDMSGKFPWEPGCEQWAVDQQPMLDKPKENSSAET